MSSVTRFKRAFLTYFEFYENVKDLELTPEMALKRKIEDMKNPPLEQGLVEREWLEFVQWLKEGYTKKKMKNTKTLGSNTIQQYSSAIKAFYSEFGYPLSAIATLPKSIRSDKQGKIENAKIEIRAKDVKELLNVMRTNKDKAISLIMFQSGMDLSTTFSLKYGDVKHGLKEGKERVIIRVKRGKSNISYRTCLGRDSLKAIRVYLREREETRWKCSLCGYSWRVKRKTCPYCKKKGITKHTIQTQKIKLNSDDYLFISHKKNITTEISNFEQRFRSYGLLAGLVTEEQLKKADFNPARPYALRSAFSSILGYKKMDRDLIEYLMGHTNRYNGAYLRYSNDEIITTYKEFEEHLSVSEIHELKDVEQRFDEKMKKHQDVYLKQIEDLEKRLKEMEERERNKAEVIRGDDSKIDVQTVLKVIETIESNPRLLKELMNGMASNKNEKK